MIKKLFFAIVILLVLLAGCAEEYIVNKNNETYITDSFPNSNDWKDVSLTDLDGNVFTVSQLNDKVTVVVLMAMWCSQSVTQQRELMKLNNNLKNANIVSIDIEAGEDINRLSNYVAKYKYDWPFALDTDGKVKNMLIKKYGEKISDPRATPIIIVDRLGREFLLEHGIKDYDTLAEEVEKHKMSE